MTADEPPPDSLDGAIADYLRRVDAGDAPDRVEFLAAHPSHADGLRSFFRDQDRFEPIVPIRVVDPDATIAPAADATGSKKMIRYFGDYELLEEIARGGMGVVYRARQVSLNRVVAVKMILAGNLADAADVARFRAEAEAAANLDHPNILPIYEVGEHEGQHYFSMKLIEGGNLAAEIRKSFATEVTENTEGKTNGNSSVFSVTSVAKLLSTIARAVHYAHQRGILHRDLKPANILLDAQGTPYVTDFGLAKRVEGDSGLTQSGAIVGTPSYMAPEQAAAKKGLSTACDVYSLGAVLYECLTGRPPFKAATPLDTVLEVLEKEPARPRSINPSADRDLETIALNCLEKDPNKRYQSAAEFADELGRWQQGKPILARPSGPARRVLKWANRNPTLTCLLVVLTLWYFDIRLPWQWVWLEWAFYGLLLLNAAWRLIIVCGKGIGRFADKQLDLFSDGIFLPATATAILVLCLYPGDLADRKSLAVAIVLTTLFWGSVVHWLWHRWQAGPLALSIRTRPQLLFVIGLLLGLLVVLDISRLLSDSSQAGDRLVSVFSHLRSLSGFVYLFLWLCSSLEIRKLGVVTFHRFVRWNEIESYDWKQIGNELFVRIKPRKKLSMMLQKNIDPFKKDMIDRCLSSFVPYSAQADATKPENLQTIDWSTPARQVRDPAALLVLSGIVQVTMALVFFMCMGIALLVNPGFEKVWEMSYSAGRIALVICAVIAATGIAVIIGAWKLRRLRGRAYCRLTARLAMLPLGLGVLFGLPGGIWALRLLKKPDVKAAFAENDGSQ